ncbi:MAG TPA: SPFH domain-containing protein, partial [Candidatus Fermentibacter sp.]|nr:SPFH domain-containing protein [Candidatus Fermentibacter sp.]
MSEYRIEEKPARSSSGMAALLLNLLLMCLSLVGFIWGIAVEPEGWGLALFIPSMLYLCLVGPVLFAGIKVLKPNEALVLTLFGQYYGTLRGPGFFYVNPFVTAVGAPQGTVTTGSMPGEISQSAATGPGRQSAGPRHEASKKISLKAMTLSNDKQKVNDALGNPIIIGIVVVWKVVNTAKALFSVDNYTEFLSIQSDAALRNIVRLYPYDASEEEGEKSLRGSSQEIAESLKNELQGKVAAAGLEIIEARITHLSYAPEIAAAMLQRQQATAIIAARQMIVEGAVGMVQMALDKLSERNIVDLDEERKAAMVSNLLVVLCGNKEAQPIVNSGTIY